MKLRPNQRAIELRSFLIGAVAGAVVGVLAALIGDASYHAWMSHTDLSRELTCEDIAGAVGRRTQKLQVNPGDRDLEVTVASLTRSWEDLCLYPRR